MLLDLVEMHHVRVFMMQIEETHLVGEKTPVEATLLDDNGVKTLGFSALDIDSLHVAVQLLFGALLVVSLSADAHAQSEWDAFDAALPNLLVQLRVEADVAGPLSGRERHVSE